MASPEHSRLRGLCRRGMKELDVVLGAYLEHHYRTANAEDRRLFRALLEMPDPELYALLLGRDAAATPELEGFVERLRGP